MEDQKKFPFSFQSEAATGARTMHVLLSYVDEGDQASVRVAKEGEVEN